MSLLPDPDPRLKELLNRPLNLKLRMTVQKGIEKPMKESHKQPKRTLKEDIKNRFGYHPPKPGQQERYTKITEAFEELALLVADLTPESREQSVALTLLWQARMAANGAIAVNE